MNDKNGLLWLAILKKELIQLKHNAPKCDQLVVTGMSYNSPNKQKNKGVPIISRYAYGKRYQDVISKKLNESFMLRREAER
jgi:epoxyqueuosine reductase QueG